MARTIDDVLYEIDRSGGVTSFTAGPASRIIAEFRDDVISQEDWFRYLHRRFDDRYVMIEQSTIKRLATCPPSRLPKMLRD